MSGFAQPALLSSSVQGEPNERWGTPPELITAYMRRFGLVSFDLDAAAEEWSHQGKAYYGLDGGWCCLGDALAAEARWCWGMERATEVWLNPPYGRGVGKWVDAALHWAQQGCRVHLLVLARTDTAWFQPLLQDGGPRRTILFLAGRIKFLDPVTHQPGNPCPVPSVIVQIGPGGQGVTCEGWDWRAR